jgi:molybdopterin molybdotransferase
MQPGKPQGFGRLASGIRVFCLPGNPVSALVSFELFVRPALATMLGRRVVLERTLTGIAGAGWSSPAGRRQYIPVEVELDSRQGIMVRPSATGGSASHLVASLAAAEGLAVVSAEVTEVRPGDAVGVLLLG